MIISGFDIFCMRIQPTVDVVLPQPVDNLAGRVLSVDGNQAEDGHLRVTTVENGRIMTSVLPHHGTDIRCRT